MDHVLKLARRMQSMETDIQSSETFAKKQRARGRASDSVLPGESGSASSLHEQGFHDFGEGQCNSDLMDV